jgi:hypothetical protein
MALGRANVFDAFGDDQFSRYASLAGLLWVANVAMALAVLGRVRLVALAVAVGALATTVSGQRAIDQQRAKDPIQDELAIALRLGLADDAPVFLFARFPPLTKRLRSIGHHPFDGSSVGDCRTLHRSIDREAVTQLPRRRARLVEARRHPFIPGGFSVRASVAEDVPTRCVAVVDGRGRVVGTGFVDRTADGSPDRVVVRTLSSSWDPRHDLLLAPSAAGPWARVAGTP